MYDPDLLVSYRSTYRGRDGPRPLVCAVKENRRQPSCHRQRRYQAREKPMSVPHYPLFIDGEWVDSPEHYEIRSPATNELVATVAKGDVSHIDRAVAAAKAGPAS